MRYIKLSILTGIGLFALAMFFLSQSIQDVLNPVNQPAQSDDKLERLDFALNEPGSLPDLNLDFPAGSKQSKASLSQTSKLDSLSTENSNGNQDQRLSSSVQTAQNTPEIKLLTLPQHTDPKSLNILLLTQTSKEQRTTLIEELIRLDADLVRQIAFKPTLQQDNNESNPIQQTSLSHAPVNQPMSATYQVSPGAQQSLPRQNSWLVSKAAPLQLIAAYRGVKITTTGIAQQNGALNQSIQIVPLVSNTLLSATIQSKNSATLNITSKLPSLKILSKSPEIKLSEVGEFQPSEVIKLTGSGLVVGLDGTGDRAHTAEAIQALKSSMKTMKINLSQIKSPIQSGNLANVSIVTYIPNQGVMKGQRVQCYITANKNNVELTGGYLLPTALFDAASSQTNTAAIVMGPILINPSQKKSGGVITDGAQLLYSIKPNLISSQGLPHLKFFLNNPSGQPQIAQQITQHINLFLHAQNSTNTKAILRSSSVIMISLPNSDQQQTQKLVTQLLSLKIPPQLSPISNPKPELIIDTVNSQIQTRGKIQLHPAIIELNQFTLEIAPPSPLTTTNLNDLLTLMQFMHIPETNQIHFLRTLQQQGKIIATYREF